MKFPKYIVKIRGNNTYGTGIIIDKDSVLTAEHLMIEEEYEIELYDGTIIKASKQKIEENELIGVLKLERSIKEDIAHLLTADYTPYSNDEWQIYGYITDEQVTHYIKGIGIYSIVEEENISDLQLTNYIIGEVNNYKGLSGSPVIVDEMIIGIVQEQITSGNSSKGIRISSISSFKKFLNEKYIEDNKVKNAFKENIDLYSNQQIEKNILSGKYIPEIFVEQKDYKEYMRFFSQPKLFINKAIDEINALDFTDINNFLFKNYRKKIKFTKINEIEAEEDLLKSTEDLLKDVEDAIELVKEKKTKQKLIKQGLDVYYREIQDYYNRSLQFDMYNIADNLRYIKYKYVLITNRAGQGKTNFICDFTRNFLLKKNFFTLYINAYEVNKDLYELVCEKLINFINNKDIEYIYNFLENEYKKELKPFIIVIDGLNENNQFIDFANIIKQFLEKISRYNFIKVIMTTRDEFYDEKFKEIENGTYTKYFNRISMFNNNSNSFQDRIFSGYLKFFNISIRKYSLHNSTFDRLSRDTLLLRFFCEANKGKKQLYMYDIYKYNVFEKYMEKKIEEYNNKKLGLGEIYKNILDKIVKYMIENKQYYHIPIDIMNKEEMEFLYELILNDVVLKDDIIVQEGYVKERKTVISFTFDEFRDFCITKYIAKKYDQMRIREFIDSLDQSYNTNIKEGTFRYLFFIGRTCSDELIEILKCNKNYDAIYWENIFELSDENINNQDIKKIENEFLNRTQNINNIIIDLIFRYDLDYFKNLNISNLFHMMEYLCEKEYDEYIQFIRQKFKPKYSEDYLYRVGRVCAYNKMIESFKILLKKKNRKVYKELFKITIYLLDVISWETTEFWELYIKYSAETAIETLKEMNNKVPLEINKNIKEITKHILNCDIKLNQNIQEEIRKIYDEK